MLKFLEFLKKLSCLLAKGKRIMWFYTMNMIALSWYATSVGKTIDTSIAAMYGAALLSYVGSKGYEYYQQQKNGKAGLSAEGGGL